jgi:hypothetical protein
MPGSASHKMKSSAERLLRSSINRHRRLLCARRERPGHHYAAEQGDEVTSFHVWMAPAWQEKM